MMEVGGFYNIAHEETYHDGDIIIKEGKSGDWVYIVLSGSVEVYKTISGTKCILGVLEPGEFFGEAALISAVKRIYTVRAIGETTVGIIDREFLDHEINKMSSGFRAILVSAVKGHIKAMDRTLGLAYRKHDRIAKTLRVNYRGPQGLVSAFVSNLSVGGAFIGTEKPLKVGEQFSLEVRLEEIDETLEISSEVAWITQEVARPGGKPPGMGVKFREMSPKDARVLKQYLEGAMEAAGR